MEKKIKDFIRKHPSIVSLPIVWVTLLILDYLIMDVNIKVVIWFFIISIVVHILISLALDMTKKVEIKTTEDLIEKAWDEYYKEKQMEVDEHA